MDRTVRARQTVRRSSSNTLVIAMVLTLPLPSMASAQENLPPMDRHDRPELGPVSHGGQSFRAEVVS